MFLGVNGLTAPVARRSATEDPEEIGSVARALDGTLLSAIQATKRNLKFETTPLTLADAAAWMHLLEGGNAGGATGLGEVWSFDSNLYGSKGTGPTVYAGASIAAGEAKFGTGALQLTSGSVLTLPTGLGSSWSVAARRRLVSAGTYAHHFIDSAGNKWVDGVASGVSVAAWFAVSGGAVSLTGDGATRFYDDLVVLPFVVPTSWPATLAAATVAFSPLPRLLVTGDAIAEGSRQMEGTVASRFVTASRRVLSVTMQEV